MVQAGLFWETRKRRKGPEDNILLICLFYDVSHFNFLCTIHNKNGNRYGDIAEPQYYKALPIVDVDFEIL